MADSSHDRILELLAKEWDYASPPGILEISEVVAALPQAPSETFAAIKALFETGLVDMNTLKTSVFLTPEGYALAESDFHKPS